MVNPRKHSHGPPSDPHKPSPGPPPERFGLYAPAPANFGRTPDPDHWPVADPGRTSYTAPADPLDPDTSPHALRPETAEWLNSPGPDYLDARGAQGAEHLEGPIFPGSRRRYRVPVIAGAVAAVVIGVVVFLVTQHSPGSAGHSAGPISSTNSLGPSSSFQPPTSNAAASHTTPDNQKVITPGSIFPKTLVTVNGLKFTRVVTAEENGDCATAAHAAFATALSSAKCARVVRATFVDAGKVYAVTAGVAALPSSAAADKVDGAKQFGPDVWFTGLDGPAHSSATVISKTVGIGYDVVYGRFIVYALATYASGRNPTGQESELQILGALSHSFAALAQQPLQS